MATQMTTGTEPAILLRNYFQDTLLKAFEKKLLAKDLCDAHTISANSGKTIAFHRINNFGMQPTGITENFGAHTVSGLLKAVGYTVDSITATLILVGNDLQLSELLMLTSEPNPLPTLSRKFLYNGTATLDMMALNAMTGNQANGTTQSATNPSAELNGSAVTVGSVWGDGSATLTEQTLDADISSHLIAAETFNKAYTTLQSRSVDFHPKLNGRYAAIIHPAAAGNLRLDATFQEIALKGNRKGEDKFERAMIGDVFNCQVMESALVPRAAGTVDATNDNIYRGIVFGDEYCATVSHAKGVGRPRVTFVPPAPSSGDPYGNIGWLSWKCYTAFAVINPGAGLVLKHVSTNAPSTLDGDDTVVDS